MQPLVHVDQLPRRYVLFYLGFIWTLNNFVDALWELMTVKFWKFSLSNFENFHCQILKFKWRIKIHFILYSISHIVNEESFFHFDLYHFVFNEMPLSVHSIYDSILGTEFDVIHIAVRYFRLAVIIYYPSVDSEFCIANVFNKLSAGFYINFYSYDNSFSEDCGTVYSKIRSRNQDQFSF